MGSIVPASARTMRAVDLPKCFMGKSSFGFDGCALPAVSLAAFGRRLVGSSLVCSALPQSVAEWGSVAIGARSGRSEVAVTLWGSGNCDAIRGGAAIGAAIGDCPAPAAAGTKAPAIDSIGYPLHCPGVRESLEPGGLTMAL